MADTVGDLRQRVDEIGRQVGVLGNEVAHLDKCLDEMKNELFGSERQSGLVGAIRNDIKKTWWAIIFLSIMMFSSGSGTVSLKTMLELLSK